jgi:Ubiquitin fusion degradation protein UFD1
VHTAGTYVKFQPRQAAFQKELGDGVSDALEVALHTRSALSVGDWLSLQHGTAAYHLRVLELQPSPSVSVIGEHRASFSVDVLMLCC